MAHTAVYEARPSGIAKLTRQKPNLGDTYYCWYLGMRRSGLKIVLTYVLAARPQVKEYR